MNQISSLCIWFDPKEIYKGDKDFIIRRITEGLSDPLYDEIQKVKEHPNFLKEPFVIAMTQKDALSIYDQCLEIVKKNRLERNLKKIAGHFLNMFDSSFASGAIGTYTATP